MSFAIECRTYRLCAGRSEFKMMMMTKYQIGVASRGMWSAKRLEMLFLEERA